MMQSRHHRPWHLIKLEALGTPITIAFEVALPPVPPAVTPEPPVPPLPVAVAEPLPEPSGVFVAAVALAFPPAPPVPVAPMPPAPHRRRSIRRIGIWQRGRCRVVARSSVNGPVRARIADHGHGACLRSQRDRAEQQNPRERPCSRQPKSHFHCLPPTATEGIECGRPKVVNGSKYNRTKSIAYVVWVAEIRTATAHVRFGLIADFDWLAGKQHLGTLRPRPK